MSSTQELATEITRLEKILKDQSIFIPPPTVEYQDYFKQRDKLTGNTKSAKKKLKRAQNLFLKERVKQLQSLYDSKSLVTGSENDCDSNESIQIVDW